jgi:hypothetical protein
MYILHSLYFIELARANHGTTHLGTHRTHTKPLSKSNQFFHDAKHLAVLRAGCIQTSRSNRVQPSGEYHVNYSPIASAELWICLGNALPIVPQTLQADATSFWKIMTIYQVLGEAHRAGNPRPGGCS